MESSVATTNMKFLVVFGATRRRNLSLIDTTLPKTNTLCSSMKFPAIRSDIHQEIGKKGNFATVSLILIEVLHGSHIGWPDNENYLNICSHGNTIVQRTFVPMGILLFRPSNMAAVQNFYRWFATNLQGHR